MVPNLKSIATSDGEARMGSPEMTSVSVSFEVRRQLNSLKAMGQFRSVDALLQSMLREHRLQRLRAETAELRERLDDLEGVDVDDLVKQLRLSPFRG